MRLWTCSGCRTHYSTLIFTCARCKSTDIYEEKDMPKITRHSGASIAGTTEFEPSPGPAVDIATVALEPEGDATEAFDISALFTDEEDDPGDGVEREGIEVPPGEVGELVVLERPPVAAPKADWLAYARQEAPERTDLESLTKAQLVEFVDTFEMLMHEAGR